MPALLAYYRFTDRPGRFRCPQDHRRSVRLSLIIGDNSPLGKHSRKVFTSATGFPRCRSKIRLNRSGFPGPHSREQRALAGRGLFSFFGQLFAWAEFIEIRELDPVFGDDQQADFLHRLREPRPPQ